jgi:hypothetical protein
MFFIFHDLQHVIRVHFVRRLNNKYFLIEFLRQVKQFDKFVNILTFQFTHYFVHGQQG